MDTSKKLGMALQEYGGKFWSIRAHTHTHPLIHTHTQKTNIRMIQHIHIQIVRI